MALNRVDRELIFAPQRDIAAGLELVGAIGGIVLGVAAELPQRRRPEVADVDPIFQRRRVSAVFGIAAAAGYSLKADRREGVRGAERVVVEDGVQGPVGERALPAAHANSSFVNPSGRRGTKRVPP